MEKPRLDGHGVLVLQGWPPAPDKEEDGAPSLFFVFIFLVLIFLSLPQAVTRALLFRAIKGEAGTPSRGNDGETE
jgi:hypothetical protein